MRMMMRAHIPVESGNKIIQDGTIKKILEETMSQIQPESAYFLSDKGQRAVFMVFDLKDPSQIPPIVEPLFINLNADVDLVPVMNVDELGKGIEDWAKAR